MKKKYDSPEWELVYFKLNDIMTASEYNPEYEDPTRDGDDSGGGEFSFP